MEDEQTNNLVMQFRSYLEQSDVQELQHAAHLNTSPDQYTLLAELTALKAEVKQEARQFKEVLTDFRTVFATLQSSHETLSCELQQHQTKEQNQSKSLLRPLLEQLLDIADRLEDAVRVSTPQQPRGLSAWLGLGHAEQQRMAALHEGQQITLRRFHDLLANQQITALQAIGKPLDPHCMRVVAIDQHADIAAGIVTEELRKGYDWNGELLRFAEVKVNKPPSIIDHDNG